MIIYQVAGLLIQIRLNSLLMKWSVGMVSDVVLFLNYSQIYLIHLQNERRSVKFPIPVENGHTFTNTPILWSSPLTWPLEVEFDAVPFGVGGRLFEHEKGLAGGFGGLAAGRFRSHFGKVHFFWVLINKIADDIMNEFLLISQIYKQFFSTRIFINIQTLTRPISLQQ